MFVKAHVAFCWCRYTGGARTVHSPILPEFALYITFHWMRLHRHLLFTKFALCTSPFIEWGCSVYRPLLTEVVMCVAVYWLRLHCTSPFTDWGYFIYRLSQTEVALYIWPFIGWGCTTHLPSLTVHGPYWMRFAVYRPVLNEVPMYIAVYWMRL